MAKALEAYSIKQKATVPYKGLPVISKTSKAYMARGVDNKGNTMCKFINEASAKQAVADGVATKGEGW